MRRAAFTITELLVVVGIVAILCGIAVPVYGAVRRSAQHASCAENLHQLGVALTLYANDHEGWVPPATTSEFEWSFYPGVDRAALDRSPEVLRGALSTYIKGDGAWFCPADPYARQNVLWLGQRHRLTSYHFDPRTPGDLPKWPPRMQIGRTAFTNRDGGGEDVPLLCDAVGVPSHDSQPGLDAESNGVSNHPDARVNAIRHDLSLSRLPAREWVGTKE